jgi:hypothetical protein
VDKPVEVSGGYYLSIKAVSNGELADVAISVRAADTGSEAAAARTYRSERTNPRRILLPAGHYRVAVKPVKLKGGVTRVLDDLVVELGATVERVVDFGSGRLRVRVLQNGAPADAIIAV